MGGSFIEALITIWVDLGLPWNKYTPMYITAAGAVLMFPFFLKNIRISQARNLLKRSNSLYYQERQEMEDAALKKVADIPVALLGLADQAIVMKRYALVERILVMVPKTTKTRREIERIRRKVDPQNYKDPISTLIKLENLLSQGLNEAVELEWNALPPQVQRRPDYLLFKEELEAKKAKKEPEGSF